MLLPIAVDCLHYQENDRPSSEELCQRLAGLKESKEYRESIQQIQDEVKLNSNQVFLLTQQLQEKDRRIQEMDDAKEQQIQDARRALQRKDNEIQERDRLLQQKKRELREEISSRESRERQVRQLNQQLEE